MEIKDKVAIVTGGANGIGCACVRDLLKHGALLVAIFDISTETTCINKLKEDFGKHRVELYYCDVSNEDQFKSNFEKVVQKHNYVDILINDAGIGNENRAARLIDVNVKGTIIGNLIAIDYMGKHKAGKGGVIVNIASVMGLLDCNILPVNSAAKHAVVSFTRSMKNNCEKIDVKIFAICPGHTRTKFDEEITLMDHYLDFVPKENIENFQNLYVQSPSNVSKAIIDSIKNAESGTVWVVENDESSFKISSPDRFTKRLIETHESKIFFC